MVWRQANGKVTNVTSLETPMDQSAIAPARRLIGRVNIYDANVHNRAQMSLKQQ